MQSPSSTARFGIVIPVCNEAECLPRVLQELQSILDPALFRIAVGVNASSDRSAEIARDAGVLVAETSRRGYGYGCQAAMDLLAESGPSTEAFIFFAGDGANDPRDVVRLVVAYYRGSAVVLGRRTDLVANYPAMGFSHWAANRFLGLWCSLLSGKYFGDIGPLRLIDRALCQRLALREMTYGWTIEAQLRAVLLQARVCEIPVLERRRIAGRQKVSRVSWRKSASIGWQIMQAGWRTRFSNACAPEATIGSTRAAAAELT